MGRFVLLGVVFGVSCGVLILSLMSPHVPAILTLIVAYFVMYIDFCILLKVNRFGCVGGRKHNPEDSMNNRETVLFKDITVSRRHFEVWYFAELRLTLGAHGLILPVILALVVW